MTCAVNATDEHVWPADLKWSIGRWPPSEFEGGRASERARLGFCSGFFDGAADDSSFVMLRSFVVQFRNGMSGKKGHRNEKNADSAAHLQS